MRTLVRAAALGALVLISLASPANAASKAKAARKAECRAACGPVVEAQCSVLRPRKARACGQKVQRSCRRRGVLAVCPPTAETTTTGTPGTPTTLAPGATTTTTTPTGDTTTTTTTIPSGPSCGGYIVLTATDSTYVGCVTCPVDSPESIFNESGVYGSSAGAASIHNHTGVYGSPASTLSACNESATSSPNIFDQQGCYYGRMTINPLVADGPCGIHGDADLCDVLRDLCTQ